jgi:hypothetical protein
MAERRMAHLKLQITVPAEGRSAQEMRRFVVGRRLGHGCAQSQAEKKQQTGGCQQSAQ